MAQVITEPPSLSQRPFSLAVDGPTDEEEQLSEVAGGNSPFRRLLWWLGYNSSEAITIRAATGLYDAVCAQADKSPLHDLVQFPPSFYSRWCALSLSV
jgi:hypothetical protein